MKLRICFTTDTHSYFFPTNFYKKYDDMNMGLFKLATMFNKDENTLIIDGGDTLQGSLLSTFYREENAENISKTMNAIGYDYITLGNHDFNYGTNYLASYIENLNAKCILSNIKSDDFNTLDYDIRTMKNGMKIAVFGVCTHHVAVWEKEETLKMLKIEKPIDSLKKQVLKVKEQVDLSICIYHGGINHDLDTYQKIKDSDENEAYEIIKTFGFDIVLSGHQHTNINKFIDATLLVQNEANAMNYCEITVEKEKGLRISARHIKPADNYDRNISKYLMSAYTKCEESVDNKIAELSIALPSEEALQRAKNGSKIANFINQIQLKESKADISACSLANNVNGFNRDLSIRDILTTYVYSNTLVVFSMTGAKIKEYMEISASYFDIKDEEIVVSDKFLIPKVEHYNYDFFYPLEYTIDVTKPLGSRINNVSLYGENLIDDKEYKFVVNSYRASGTAPYNMIKDCKIISCIDNEVSEIIISTLQKEKYFNVDEHIYYKLIK